MYLASIYPITSATINALLALIISAALSLLALDVLVKLIGAGVNAASGPAAMISVIKSIMSCKARLSVSVAAGKLVTWLLTLPGDLVTVSLMTNSSTISLILQKAAVVCGTSLGIAVCVFEKP